MRRTGRMVPRHPILLAERLPRARRRYIVHATLPGTIAMSSAQPSPPAIQLAAERDRVVQALSAHFANDLLTLEELDDRLARAYHATSLEQVRAALADLPALRAAGELAAPQPLLVPAADVPPRGVVIAVMAGNERGGSWIVPRQLKVFALMGGVELDLREARFGPGVTEIDVTAVMGGVEVILPPGVRVESVGAAFMGAFEAKAGDASALSPLNPIVRLSGLAVMGGVETKTRRPGKEKKRDA